MITDKSVNSRIVGYYLIDNKSKLGLMEKPSKLRRFFIKIFLGWKYVNL